MLILQLRDPCRRASMIFGKEKKIQYFEHNNNNYDYRRMIWEKDVSVLVMITNIKERGRVCVHIWTFSYFENVSF